MAKYLFATDGGTRSGRSVSAALIHLYAGFRGKSVAVLSAPSSRASAMGHLPLSTPRYVLPEEVDPRHIKAFVHRHAEYDVLVLDGCATSASGHTSSLMRLATAEAAFAQNRMPIALLSIEVNAPAMVASANKLGRAYLGHRVWSHRLLNDTTGSGIGLAPCLTGQPRPYLEAEHFDLLTTCEWTAAKLLAQPPEVAGPILKWLDRNSLVLAFSLPFSFPIGGLYLAARHQASSAG